MSDRPVFSRVGTDGKSHTIHRRKPCSYDQHKKKKGAYYDKSLNRWVFPDSPEQDKFGQMASVVHPVLELDLTRFIAEKTHHITDEMEDLIKHVNLLNSESHTDKEKDVVNKALQQYTEELHKLDEMKWNDLKDFDNVGDNRYSHKHRKNQFPKEWISKHNINSGKGSGARNSTFL